MKILALDIGDRWTGVAISDPLGIFPRPYDTVKSHELKFFLDTVTQKEKISTIVVGLPTTLRGTQSEQTKKIIAEKETLEKEYPTVTWILWDERFTSRQAATIKPAKTKEDKLKSHAIAAALILSTYLEFKRMQSSPADNSY
jgi:putative Holliday junction resolvase